MTLQQGRQRPLTGTQKRDLLSFARDMPGLWEDPPGLPGYKKRLLRIALKEIIAACEGETIRLVLHWQGGDHTQVEFEKIRTGGHRFVTGDDLVEIVRMLARIEPDVRIASILLAINGARHTDRSGRRCEAARCAIIMKFRSIVKESGRPAAKYPSVRPP